MPGVQIDRAAAVKIAKQLGAQGKPLPAEMAGDAGLLAAYDQAKAGAANPTPAPAKKAPAKKAPAKSAPTKAKPSRPAAATPPAATTPPAAPTPDPMKGLPTDVPGSGARRAVQSGVRYARSGSTGSGVLLAFVIYPTFLSILKYGAAGPGRWFRAKWLNKVSTDTPTAQAVTPMKPRAVPHGPVQSGSGAPGKFPVTS